MSYPKNQKKAGTNVSALSFEEQLKKNQDYVSKTKKKTESNKIKTYEEQLKANQDYAGYKPVPELKKVETKSAYTVPAYKMTTPLSNSGSIQNPFKPVMSSDEFMTKLDKDKKKKQLDYYSDDEIKQMYDNAKSNNSEYGALDRLFNKDAKNAYNKYNELSNEMSKRDTQAKAQIMNERNAYDDVAYLGRLRLVYDDETGQPYLYDDGLKRDYERITASLKSKGYTDDEIRDINDFAYQVADDKELADKYKFADSHPTLASGQSLVSNALKPVDYLRKGVLYASGEEMDPNDYVYSDTTQALREGASADMGNVGQFLYNTGMSMADSLVSRGVAGGLSPLLMGMGSAEDATKDALNRGADATDALATGLASGVAESAFEKLELDKLKAFQQVPGKGVKNFLGNVGKQMLNEGASEGATEIANALSDYFINGENSEFTMSVDAYEAQGMSHDEAVNSAMADVAKNVGLNALGGMLSGGVMGAGYQMVGNINGNNQVPTLEQNNPDTIQNVGQSTNQTMQDLMRLDRPQGTQTQNMDVLTGQTTEIENINEAKGNPDLQNSVNKAEYSTKKIDGFPDLNKNLDKLVGMYKGNENTDAMFSEMKASINEYLQTYDQDAINRALILASDIDDSLVGHSYTRKGNGKNSVKSQNRRVTTTYENGSFVDELMSYQRELRDTARDTANANNSNFSNPGQLNPFESQNKIAEEVTANSDNTQTELPFQMAENTGLNTTTSSPVAEAEYNVRENNTTKTSQVATNTFQNSKLFKDVEANQAILQEEIKNKKLNVDVKSEMQSLKEAAQRLDADFEGEKNRLNSDEAYSGVETDEAFMILEHEAKLAAETGDYTQVRKWMRTITNKGHSMAQGLQAFAKYSRSAEGTLVKTQNYIDDKVKHWRKNNKRDAEASKTVAKSILAEVEKLKNFSLSSGANLPISSDYVSQMVKDTIGKTRLRNKVDNQAVDYITQQLINGADEAQLNEDIDTFLTSGIFGLSDEDINTVINLFDEASHYGDFSKQRYDIEQKAYALIANKVSKASFMDKWDAWRYLSMLGNTRTHIRNIGGNNMFGAVTGIKNSVAAALEAGTDKINRKFGGQGIERTKALLNPTQKSDKALIDAGKRDAVDNVYTLLNDGHKYSVGSELERNKTVFRGKLLEEFRKFNDDMLNREDFAGLKNKYSTSLAGYLKANGKDASIFTSQTPEDINLLTQARTYAIEQAKIATFHEYSTLANWINSSRQLKDGNAISKAGYMLEQGLLPFTQTPVNILKQGVKYTPISLAQGLYRSFEGVRTGKYSANEAIDSIATGLTGSGIMALGAFLAAQGFITGGPDEDKDNFNKLVGRQNYALNIGEHSYTIDWMAPFALPLFVGVELQKMYDGEGESFLNSASKIGEPILEMSMLSGLNDTLDSIANTEKGDRLLTLSGTMATSYLTQGVPTALGQLARSVDDTRRSTYTGKKGMENILNKTVKQSLNKIPGASMLNEPYVDAWGREQNNTGGSFIGRLAYNTLSPGYYSNANLTEVDKYLEGLYDETAQKKVLPSTPSTSFTYDNEKVKLSPEEYTQYSKARGNAAYDLFEKYLDKNPNNLLSTDLQAKVAESIYDLASDIGKSELGYEPDSKVYNIYKQKGSSSAIEYMMLNEISKERYDKQSFSSIKNVEALDVVNALGASKEDAGYYLYNRDSNEKIQKVYDQFNDYGAIYDYYNLDALSREDNNNLTDTGNSRSFADSSYDKQLQYMNNLGMNTTQQEQYIAALHKDDKKTKPFYNTYGASGLYDLYRLRKNAEVDGKEGTSRNELLPVLKNMPSLTEQQKADYLYYGVTNGINTDSAKYTAFQDYGTIGAYRYDDIYVSANTDGKGNKPNQKEVETYLRMCNFSQDQKYYYWDLFYPNAKKRPNF